MTKRPVALLLSATALSLGVAACGGSDSDKSASNGNATTQAPASAMPSSSPNIVALAQGQSDLSTLVKAVSTADLAKTLEGKGPYTVFAPTNQAFAAVGQDTLNQLLAPAGQQQLRSVLTYHVVPGDVRAAALKNGQVIKTVQGQDLRVSISDDQVKINGATVIKPDVAASNGVVHVIDRVLLPPKAS